MAGVRAKLLLLQGRHRRKEKMKFTNFGEKKEDTRKEKPFAWSIKLRRIKYVGKDDIARR